MKIEPIRSGECLDLSQLPEEVKQQLEILNHSQSLTLTIVAGILMRYKSMDLQKQQLICSTLCPDQIDPNGDAELLQLQVASSLVILYALFGFHQQSQCLLQQACENDTVTSGQKLDLTLSTVSILVALIRLFQTIKDDQTVQNKESPLLTTEGEELLEPDF